MTSLWGSRSGGDSGLSTFSKRQWRNRSPLRGSPTTVLSAESSAESSSDASADEPVAQSAMCSFEPINSKTWTVSTDRPSDLLIEVDEISFHLHKLPVLSKSGLLSILAAKFNESETAHINLGSIPGGAEAFALATKFCYGMDVELTPGNVVGLRCAAEYLEMTEELEEGNVSSKAEAYFNSVILNSWQESIVALQSCEHLLPVAEDVQIVRRCSESIARKASVEPRNVRWSSASSRPNVANVKKGSGLGENWWYEDIASLSLYCFEKVMVAMAQNLMNGALMGGVVELYTQKWLPGVFKTSAENSPRISASSPTGEASPVNEFPSPSRDTSSTGRLHHVVVEQNRNRFVIEKIVGMLPNLKDSVACSFLLRMLRAANMFNCSVECRTELELKAGQQLDQASLSDLLIPSFCHTSEYLYDVDLVRRLLDHFLALEQGSLGAGLKNKFFNKRIFGGLFVGNSTKQAQAAPSTRLKAVSKLMDSYLAEVARDCKLPLEKFHSLAEAVPVSARMSDDGLYRAIDTYLKIHTNLAEHEKKKLCRNLDCSRFSVAACLHAAQNERLPLRIIVQVLFGEQLKLRDAITGITQSILEDRATSANVFGTQQSVQDNSPDSVGSQQAMLQTTNQMEIRALQQEITTMRMKYTELERNYSTMMELVEKLVSKPRRNSPSSWSPWKKPSKGDRSQDSPSKADLESSTSGRSRTNAQNGAQRWRNSIS
ncbi:hypothetical protein M758_7G166100 [Ceratodon purpureus]|nr:hypothetical protein M758_7G166100 [Ceratodon purpureus]